MTFDRVETSQTMRLLWSNLAELQKFETGWDVYLKECLCIKQFGRSGVCWKPWLGLRFRHHAKLKDFCHSVYVKATKRAEN